MIILLLLFSISTIEAILTYNIHRFFLTEDDTTTTGLIKILLIILSFTLLNHFIIDYLFEIGIL